MDNISRRLSNEDTATSMYLSFDAESTMSTACYKTMEAMSDMSAISMIDCVDESIKLNTDEGGDKHMNSTLEADKDSSSDKSPVKTIKKMELKTLNTPLRALPKNILKEYKALCSTPSKEQLMKSVDVTRGSDATRCIDLGLAFLGIDDDEKPAYFPPPALEQCDDKENAQPESEEGSTLSVSSSVEITTSVIERKLLSSVSTVGSITEEEESIEEVQMIETVEELLLVKETIETTPKANKDKIFDVLIENNDGNVDNTPKAIQSKLEKMETITELFEKPDELTPKVNELEVKKNVASKSTGKPKIAVLSSRNTRRSVCEPNLETNRPSRIVTSGRKRQSLLPTSRQSTIPMDAEREIPLLMSKLLKISNNTAMQVDEVATKKEEQPVEEPKKCIGPTEKRRSLMNSMKTRTSLIPSAAGDKRPFSFTQRMSIVVKTTLNSPARKMARKSSMGASMTGFQRRSMMPTAKTTESSKLPQNLLITRRSFIPKTGIATNTKTVLNSLGSLKENSSSTTTTSTTITERKSLYPLNKAIEESKIKPPSGLSYNKPDAIFICNVCKEKFRVKSLLDAHKRTHENDNAAPAFLKKPSVTSASNAVPSSAGTLAGNPNQCKYCDKKFALVRALHIHLLQNCSKIPPAEKRKLQYTDLNHVEKAQLPNVFTHHHSHQQSNSSSNSSVSSTAAATPRNVIKPYGNTMAFPKRSTEVLSENKGDHNSPTDNITVEASNMAPPQKMKKHTAHSGVYKTPSKKVPCHLCKLTFKSILDYTNHSLSAHASNKTNNSEAVEVNRTN